MWKSGETQHSLFHRADADGYPCMDFEDWYQQGKRCYWADLPKPLIKQALNALARKWAKANKPVSMWHIRAFVYGVAGGVDKQARWVRLGYKWPLPPDPSWNLVVCYYRDGTCDLDMAHPVSRRFWSEHNDFIELPEERTNRFTRVWYEEMGFEVMVMMPVARIEVGKPARHLSIAR